MSWRSTDPLSQAAEKAHLRRWFGSALVAAYFQYASLGLHQTALHLGLFEQPGREEAISLLSGLK